MPHIKDAEKVELKARKRVKKMGELCFLFAEGALTVYSANPRWASIHDVARALFINPYHEEWSHAIARDYGAGVTQQDVKTAAFLALLEFYRIVGAPYEDGMIAQNGNCFAGAKIPSQGDMKIELGSVRPDSPDDTDIDPPPATPEALTPVDNDVTIIENVNLNPVKRKAGRPKKVGA